MSILKIYNQLKEEMGKAGFQDKMKKLKLPLKDLNKFLTDLGNLYLIETIVKGFYKLQLNKGMKNSLLAVKADKLRKKLAKKAREGQCHKAGQGARILFMPLQGRDSRH